MLLLLLLYISQINNHGDGWEDRVTRTMSYPNTTSQESRVTEKPHPEGTSDKILSMWTTDNREDLV